MATAKRRVKKLQKTTNPTYRILATDGLPQRVKQMVDVKMKSITTGDEAKTLAGHDGFGYKALDMVGRVGILQHNGVDVAVFFNRQIISVTSDECDPAPQCKIEDPKESWVRIELLHIKAAKSRNTWFSEREKSLTKELDQYKGLCRQKDAELELLQKTHLAQDQQIIDLKDKLEADKKIRMGYYKQLSELKQQLAKKKKPARKKK